MNVGGVIPKQESLYNGSLILPTFIPPFEASKLKRSKNPEAEHVLSKYQAQGRCDRHKTELLHLWLQDKAASGMAAGARGRPRRYIRGGSASGLGTSRV